MAQLADAQAVLSAESFSRIPDTWPNTGFPPRDKLESRMGYGCTAVNCSRSFEHVSRDALTCIRPLARNSLSARKHHNNSPGDCTCCVTVTETGDCGPERFFVEVGGLTKGQPRRLSLRACSFSGALLKQRAVAIFGRFVWRNHHRSRYAIAWFKMQQTNPL